MCVQIKQRFAFDGSCIIAQLKILSTKALSADNAPMSIAILAAQLKNLVPESKLNDLDDEYWSFRLTKDLHCNENNENISIPEFWFNKLYIKDGLDQPKYKNLSEFMTSLTILPHSSACVERIFSQVNSVKTARTNSFKANDQRPNSG